MKIAEFLENNAKKISTLSDTKLYLIFSKKSIFPGSHFFGGAMFYGKQLPERARMFLSDWLPEKNPIFIRVRQDVLPQNLNFNHSITVGKLNSA